MPQARSFPNLSAGILLSIAGIALTALDGCKKPAPPPPAMAAMPVQVSSIALNPVPVGDTYVATIKSRRSATMQPQVDGNLTRILVHSGDAVKAGQLLMQIDPLKQVATLESQQAAQAQAKASLEYNQTELARQKKLLDLGVISREAYDQAVQSFGNAKGAYDSSAALTNTQRQQLAYYQIRAPFEGIVGDIPVHVGDYVTATTVLTTVDENRDLEAYIYIPTDRASLVRMGLPVELLDTNGTSLLKTSIDFISPQVDNGTQGILAKASLPASSRLRTQQIVNARVTWSTSPKPTVPVLAVVRIGGQPFVYVAKPQGNGFIAHQVAITVGETTGNDYPVLTGLNTGDKVVLSGLQFLQEGQPVMPLPPMGPPPTH